MTRARKSGRLEKKPRVVYDSGEEAVDDCTQDKSVTAKKPKATSSTATRKPFRGKRGILAQLTEFPLDVLFEIFTYLTPHDLLRLTRTTKTLRNLLHKRSSLSVWKGARSNVEGLPETPDDLSEPAYASLAFDNWCSDCFAPNVKFHAWSVRKRLCQKCLNNTTRYVRTPFCVVQLNHGELIGCYISFEANLKQRGYPLHRSAYSVEHILEVQAKYSQLLDQKPSATEIEEWIKTKKVEVEKRMEQSKALSRWSESIKDQHDADLQGLRNERRDAICEKLIQLGYGNVLEKFKSRYYHPLDNLKQINVAKKLTPGDWIKMKDRVCAVMDEHKARIAREERDECYVTRCNMLKKVVKEYFTTLPFDHISPGYGDIIDKPSIKELLFETPVGETIPDDRFLQIVEEMPELTREWRKDATALLLKKSPAGGMDRLQLATTVFQCSRCAKLLWYPRVLAHTCCLRKQMIFGESIYRYVDGVRPWSPDCLTFSGEFTNLIKDLLRQVELDPETTTYSELASRNLLLEFKVNGEMKYLQDRLVRFDNLNAFKPYMLKAYDVSVVTDREVISEAEGLEKDSWKLFCERPVWLGGAGIENQCKECDAQLRRTELWEHFAQEHGKEECSPSDFVFRPDSPYYPSPVDLKPTTNMFGHHMADFFSGMMGGGAYDDEVYDDYPVFYEHDDDSLYGDVFDDDDPYSWW